MYVALKAAELGAGVALVSRKSLAESSSYWAQGGLAAALADDDSPERHAQDTIDAGRGACRAAAVEVLTREAPGAVEELRELGVRFDTEPDGELALGLEGGHSARRIVHAGGSETGRALTRRLETLVAEEPRVQVLEGASAVALAGDAARCTGVVTDRGTIAARATVLTTGGAAALWARTTNPWGAIGAGVALAHLAGAEAADLEFCQFHPTALALPGEGADGSLLTEAIRGEGAVLLDADGRRFTDELAPRDQVTAAVLDRMQADATDHVMLDMRAVDPSGFPNVVAMLEAAGIDPTTEPVPVAPAAHYVMGGVATDLDGATSVAGLHAVGECACTGLHGANRLASNSLSECFVFGARAAAAAARAAPLDGEAADPGWRFSPPTAAAREQMWRWAGPQRDAAGLERLLDHPYPVSSMVATAALAREETRGAHRRVEFPRPDPGLDGIHLVQTAAGETESRRWS